MNASLKRKFVDKLPLLIIPTVIVLDQITKALFVLIAPTICNSGVAFGLLGGGFKIETFSIGIILIIGWIFLKGLLFSKSTSASLLGMALILGGGMSNFLDRLTRGCVVDFIDFKIWPSFNLADTSISLGVFILIYVSFKK